MSDYWIHSPDNPFNQMNWTRGGGGFDNRDTHLSNDLRASAMVGSGAGALPHYATMGVAEAASAGKMYAVVDGNVIRTSGHDPSPATSGGGAGPGSSGVSTAQPGSPTKGAGSGPGSRLTIAAPSWPSLGPAKGPGSKNKMPYGDAGEDQRKIPLPYSDEFVLMLEPDERFVDVEDFWEKRYGEPGEWIGGLTNFFVDLDKNFGPAVLSSIKVQPGGVADTVGRGVVPHYLQDDDLPNPMQFNSMSGWQ